MLLALAQFFADNPSPGETWYAAAGVVIGAAPAIAVIYFLIKQNTREAHRIQGLFLEALGRLQENFKSAVCRIADQAMSRERRMLESNERLFSRGVKIQDKTLVVIDKINRLLEQRDPPNDPRPEG